MLQLELNFWEHLLMLVMGHWDNELDLELDSSKEKNGI